MVQFITDPRQKRDCGIAFGVGIATISFILLLIDILAVFK
jgi:hypothetical protein